MATTGNGLVYPVLADSPNGPVQMQALADSAKAVPAFLSSGSSAALTTTPVTTGLTPYVGMRVVNYNTADPAEVRIYTCIDASPVRWLNQPWNQPWGFIDEVIATAASTGTTTTTGIVIPGATKSVALVQNRRYQFAWTAMLTSTVTSDVAQARVTVAGTVRATSRSYIAASTAGARVDGNYTWISTLTSGSQTVELHFGRFSGTGTIGHRCDVEQATLIISDAGPGGQPV